MQLIDRLASFIGIKRQTSDDKIVSTTVKIGDATSKQFASTDQASLVARFVGYAAVCARLNATTTAGVRVRLYRKGRPGTRSRALSNAAKRRLFDERQVGYKVATYADKAGDDIVEVMDHPALEVLNNPSARVSGNAYWSTQERYLEIAGNAYDHVWFEGGRPWLSRMMPQHTTVQPDESDVVEGYWYGRDSGRRLFFAIDEVGHQKFEQSLYDPYYGTGPLSSMLSEHDLRVVMNQHATNLFQNGARPDAHLSWPNRVGEDALKKAHAEFNRQYAGARNAGKWIITDGDAKVSPLGFPLKDLEYQAGRQKLESDIMAAFGVPESLLRLNDANLASAATGDYAYMRFTILPRALRRQEYLNEWLLGQVFGIDPADAWFAIDNPVPKDEAAEGNNTRADVLAGVLTANEARLVRGYEKIADENADALLINGRPLAEPAPDPFGGFGGFGGTNQDGATQPTDQPVPDASTNQATGAEGVAPTDRLSGIDAERASIMLGQVSTGEQSAEVVLALLISMGIPEERAKEMVASADAFVPTTPPEQAAPVPAQTIDNQGDAAKAAKPCCAHDGPVSARDLWMGSKGLLDGEDASPLTDPPTDTLILTINNFFAKQRDAIIREMYAKPMGKQFGGSLVRKDAAAAAKEVAGLLKAWEIDDLDANWTQQLVDAVGPDVDERLFRAAVEGVRTIRAAVESAQSGEPVADFDSTNEGAARFIQQNGRALYQAMRGVNETTAARLALTLEDGVRNGEALHGLVQRVRSAFDGEASPGEPISLHRAKMIARTETARAETDGTLAGWQSTGVVTGKRWFLAPNPCEFCEAAAIEYANKTTALDQPFYTTGSVLRGTDGGVMNFDFADVQGAPLHPHCRCAVQPVLLGAS